MKNLVRKRLLKLIFLIEDFVVYALTGNAQIDYSLAARTMAFDIRKLEWSADIFDAAGIDKSLMSQTVPIGTSAGCIKEEIANQTGFSRELQIVSISHDRVAAAVGAATPYMDTGSKGAIIGLTATSSVSDIYRACMEGVVYEMLDNMEYLQKAGTSFKMLHATGGGAHSAVWMQMKADMLGLPITALKTVDAGTVGSAMLTGIAVGCFKDLDDAAGHMVEKTITYYPREEMHHKYQKIYERYRKLYEAVRPLV